MTRWWRVMDSNHRFLARKSRFLLPKANCGDRTGAAKKGCFSCGTDGSNPSPSSSESRANLISTVGVVGSKRVFNLANPAEILSPLMLAACGAGKRRVQGAGKRRRRTACARPSKTRSTRICSASFSNTAGKVSRNLNPAHKLLEGIAKLFGMASNGCGSRSRFSAES